MREEGNQQVEFGKLHKVMGILLFFAFHETGVVTDSFTWLVCAASTSHQAYSRSALCEIFTSYKIPSYFLALMEFLWDIIIKSY